MIVKMKGSEKQEMLLKMHKDDHLDNLLKPKKCEHGFFIFHYSINSRSIRMRNDAALG